MVFKDHKPNRDLGGQATILESKIVAFPQTQSNAQAQRVFEFEANPMQNTRVFYTPAKRD
jgi:hypothetical protein